MTKSQIEQHILQHMRKLHNGDAIECIHVYDSGNAVECPSVAVGFMRCERDMKPVLRTVAELAAEMYRRYDVRGE